MGLYACKRCPCTGKLLKIYKNVYSHCAMTWHSKTFWCISYNNNWQLNNSAIWFTTRIINNKHLQVQSIGVFSLSWLHWLLQLDALLDTSTNTRHLSAVSFILPTNLTHLANMNNSLNTECVWHINIYSSIKQDPWIQFNRVIHVLISVWNTNLALSADFGASELLSVLDSGIAVNFLPLWCEPLVLGHLLNW